MNAAKPPKAAKITTMQELKEHRKQQAKKESMEKVEFVAKKVLPSVGAMYWKK